MKTTGVIFLLAVATIANAQTAVPFSTPKDEYAPSITTDGRRIYFTALRPGGLGGLDIWYADREDSSWGDPQNVGAPVNTALSERASAISADGKTMILTMSDQADGYGDCDLYVTTMQPDGTWSKPVNLGASVNSSSWESFPTISRDGRTIYFSSDRSGGQGAIDIYMSTRSAGGEWSEAVNIGAPVNTPGNDVTPYLSLDDSTLYYASDGFSEDKADLDIYVARRAPAGWQTPVPVTPVNTSSQELFPSMSGNQRVMYFCSTRNGKKSGMDIFSMPLPEAFRPRHAYTVLAGKVTDKENNLPLKATVTVNTDDADSSVARDESNPLTGSFSFLLPRGRTHRVTASATDFYMNIAEVSIDSNADERVACTVALERVQIGKPHIAVRVFQEGTDLLTREGQAEMKKLNTLFRQSRTMRAALFVNNEEGSNDTLLRQLRIERLQANLRRVNRDLTNIDWKPLPFQGEALEPKINYIVLVPILN